VQPTQARHVRLLLIATLAALAVPASAQAHHGGVPVVALDYRNRLLPVGSGLHGVEASLGDAGRRLRLTVDGSREVLVLGYVDEPFLRFSRAGVEVNERSPTAQADRLVPANAPRGLSWRVLSRGRSFEWRDSRLLAPPPGARGQHVASWTIPLVVDGHSERLAGELVRQPRPAWWPWAAVVVVALGGAWLLARRRRAIVLCGVAAAGTAVSLAGLGFGSEALTAGSWLASALELVALAGGLVLVVLTPKLGAVGVATIAAVAVLQALDEVSIYGHGVVVSALPAVVARLAAALSLAAGVGAGLLVFVAPAAARPASRRVGLPRAPLTVLRKDLR
jgi:hypothetical protein